MKQYGSFEGLDNRRELWELLDRLGDGVAPEVGCARRREFLAWACRQAKFPGGHPVRVDPKTVGLTREIYCDVVSLCSIPEYRVDLELHRGYRVRLYLCHMT